MSKLDHAEFLQGDAKEKLSEIPDETVQTAVTSPPYWGLRDYDAEGQIGLEPTPEEYVENLVDVFRELRRTLRPDGTFWLNIGDSYYNYRPGKGQDMGKQSVASTKQDLPEDCPRRANRIEGLKEKDLVGIPWRVAFALQEDGWYLRSDIIWNKPAPMPESIKDRPTSSHEHVFLFAKNKNYYYDHEAIKEPTVSSAARRASIKDHFGSHTSGDEKEAQNGNSYMRGSPKKNKRDVWEVSTKPSGFAHFAVYPLELVEPCVKAGTSAFGQCKSCGAPYERVLEEEKVKRNREERFTESKFQHAQGLRGCSSDHVGTTSETVGWKQTCDCDTDDVERQTVLDPFSGAATTGIAALKHGRRYVGIEINEDYIELSKERIRDHTDVPTNHDFW